MNILGVGPGEIVVVLILMLVVAGPKRMVEWAYHIGRYTSKLRAMFQETMNVIQKELAESGVDVPKELTNIQNTRFDIVREASKIINTEPSPAVSGQVTPPADSVDIKPVPPPATDPNPTSDSNSQPDSDKPRYDAWTPN